MTRPNKPTKKKKTESAARKKALMVLGVLTSTKVLLECLRESMPIPSLETCIQYNHAHISQLCAHLKISQEDYFRAGQATTDQISQELQMLEKIRANAIPQEETTNV